MSHESRPSPSLDTLLVKLRALRKPVAQNLKDPRARYFDPEIVLEYFTKYGDLAAKIRVASGDLFGDLAERELPKSSGTTDYQGRGYIERRYLQRLVEDIDYIVDVGTDSSGGSPKHSEVDVDRRFMELAVEQAAKSLSERGRNSPRVGAVIARGDQLIATAHRGELKTGEHAEFTALEGKCSSIALAGATVYTTLEPCTTRHPPKTPCVERLIARKVSRVVIGMLDPNDMIRGRGILILRRANIEVGLFPPDLMAQLEELNRDFIAEHESKQAKSFDHMPSNGDALEDKWVSVAYVESSGIGAKLKGENFDLAWIGADDEAEYVDHHGWKPVVHEQDGTKYRLKVRDPSVGGYLVLLQRPR